MRRIRQGQLTQQSQVGLQTPQIQPSRLIQADQQIRLTRPIRRTPRILRIQAIRPTRLTQAIPQIRLTQQIPRSQLLRLIRLTPRILRQSFQPNRRRVRQSRQVSLAAVMAEAAVEAAEAAAEAVTGTGRQVL